MFIHWKKKRLVEGGYLRIGSSDFDTCSHDLDDGERWKLTPVVKHSIREGGVPRHKTLWHPALGIRLCCIEDQEYPLVRARFWIEVNSRLVVLRKNRGAPYRKLLLEYEPWIVEELGKVVPLPDALDFEIASAWPNLPPVREETLRDYLLRLYRLTRTTIGGDASCADGEGEGTLSPEQAAAILGLAWPCTVDSVKAAYRKAAFLNHPDQGGSHEKMVEVNVAMQVLQQRLM